MDIWGDNETNYKWKKELNEAIQLGMKPHLYNFTGVLPLSDWQKMINQW